MPHSLLNELSQWRRATVRKTPSHNPKISSLSECLFSSCFGFFETKIGLKSLTPYQQWQVEAVRRVTGGRGNSLELKVLTHRESLWCARKTQPPFPVPESK